MTDLALATLLDNKGPYMGAKQANRLGVVIDTYLKERENMRNDGWKDSETAFKEDFWMYSYERMNLHLQFLKNYCPKRNMVQVTWKQMKELLLSILHLILQALSMLEMWEVLS